MYNYSVNVGESITINTPNVKSFIRYQNREKTNF